MTVRPGGRAGLLAFGILRVAIGSTIMARPSLLPTAVGVDSVTAAKVRWLSLMVGARDLVIGAGLVDAVYRRQDPRPWLGAGLAADIADVVGFTSALATGAANPVTGTGSALMAMGGVGWGAEALRQTIRAG